MTYLTEEKVGVGVGAFFFMCPCAFPKGISAKTKAKLKESEVKKHNGACLVPPLVPTSTTTTNHNHIPFLG